MSYISPIKIEKIQQMEEGWADKIGKYIAGEVDNLVLGSCVKVGCHVDKDELEKALRYDRGQYFKGYADGKRDAAPRWHRVEDGLPDDEVPVLAMLHNTYGRNVVLKLCHIGHHKRTTEEYGWQEYEGETEYDEENDCFWIPEGWWESNYHEDNLNWEIDETDGTITHWMPLPEPPKEDGKMSNVVTELLARIGEASALKALMGTDVLTGETDIPNVRVRQHCMDDSMDVSYEIEGEPRRLVYVPGFDWMWYNAEGPES